MTIHHIKSAAEFDALLASTMYVVSDFYADWCGPCKAIAPAYEQMARTFSVPGYLGFAKVNVDTAQPVAARYNVTAMPTFAFFKQGQQVAVNGNARIKGANMPTLTAAVEKLGKLAKEKKDAAAAAA